MIRMFRNIGIALPTVSAFLIASAFIYNKFYYNHFGIDIGEYFKISDYLSSSVEKLYIIFYSIIFATLAASIGFFLGKKDVVREGNYIDKIKPSGFWNYLKIFFYSKYFDGIMLFLLFCAIIRSMFLSEKYFIDRLFLIFFFTTSLFVLCFAKIYFKNIRWHFFPLVFFPAFIAAMYKEISLDILSIEKDAVPECGRIELAPSVPDELDTCKLIWLGANSGYAFFRNTETGESVVLSRSDILYRRHDAVERRSTYERFRNLFGLDANESLVRQEQ